MDGVKSEATKRWLLCAYEENRRSPRSVMFYGTPEQLGWARAGVAKLNERFGWTCSYHEFGLYDQYPTSNYMVEGDTVMLSEWFEDGVCRNHPMTGEPVVPPECFTAMCRAAFEGDVADAFSGLFSSRGWIGEMTAVRMAS